MKAVAHNSSLHFRPWFAWALLAVVAAATISLFVSFQMGLFALGFVIVAWWVWQYPEEAFLLFLLLAPLLSMFKATQSIGSITLVKDVIIVTLFVRVVVYPLLTKQLSYRRAALLLPVVVLGAWSAFAMVRSDSIILGILRARDIGLYALLYFVVLFLPHDLKIWKRRLFWFTVSVLITLALSIFQWFWAQDSAVLRFDPVRSVWIPRLSSTFGHPSVYGEYLVLAASVFGAAFLAVRRTAWRYLYAGLFLFLLPAIFFTYSRGVWIGFVVAVAAMGCMQLLSTVQRHGQWKLFGVVSAAMVGGGVVMIGLVMWMTPLGAYTKALLDPKYASNEIRIEFAARLVAPMSNYEALIGRGLGDVTTQNFRQVELEAYDIASGSSRDVQLTKDSTLVDNQFLKSFVELGLFGLLIYVWIYWRIVKVAWHVLTVGEGRAWHKGVSLAGVGFVSAFIVQGLFIDIWDVFPTNALFWIMAGLVGGVAATSQNTVRGLTNFEERHRV